MTNEEKAKDIAFNHRMTYLELENDGSVYDVDSYDECLDSAMEMAAWKEEQVCEFLRTNPLLQRYSTDGFIEKLIAQWKKKQKK